jgi:uncharacterized protein (UPF0335 family)
MRGHGDRPLAGPAARRYQLRLDAWTPAEDERPMDEHTTPTPEPMTISVAPTTKTVGTTADRLRSFVDRIERLEEEKAGLADDIKDVYHEAKGEGFDVKVLRKVISLRKKDPQERAEEEELLELYLSALGAG